jgi:hypothetical protein
VDITFRLLRYTEHRITHPNLNNLPVTFRPVITKLLHAYEMELLWTKVVIRSSQFHVIKILNRKKYLSDSEKTSV